MRTWTYHCDAPIRRTITLAIRSAPLLVALKQSILIPNYEAFAVTILLMTLKMIFRLDGVTEFLLSHLVQELERLPETRVRNHSTDSFRFKEWFQFSSNFVALITCMWRCVHVWTLKFWRVWRISVNWRSNPFLAFHRSWRITQNEI